MAVRDQLMTLTRPSDLRHSFATFQKSQQAKQPLCVFHFYSSL